MLKIWAAVEEACIFYKTSFFTLEAFIRPLPENTESTYTDTMIRINSTEFQRRIGLYQDLALREAVIVTFKGRERFALISAKEYHRLRALGMERDKEITAAEELRRAVALVRRAVAQRDEEMKGK